MGKKITDLTGMTFGRLTVLGYDRTKSNKVYWKCRCSCGKEIIVESYKLRTGHTKSCGCLRKEIAKDKIINLVGENFGRLCVIAFDRRENNTTYWRCKCECGSECVVQGGHLVSGHTQSCGCLKNQRRIESHTKHGMSGSSVHRVWLHIKGRCFNPNDRAYKDYGGRGITIYAEWRDDFQTFYDYVSKLEHFGEEGYTLDRIDNNGNYEPDNVRWATPTEQGRNKRNNVIVEYKGKKMTAAEAAEKSGIDGGVLRSRAKRGNAGNQLFRPTEREMLTVNYNGEIMSVPEAAEKAGVPAYLVYSRIQREWSDEYLFVPNQGRVQKGAPPKK